MSTWYQIVESGIVRIEAYKTPIDYTRPDIVAKQDQSIGTGFFVPIKSNDANWYAIVTCAHVVSDTHADQLSIVFPKIGKKRFRSAQIQCLCPEYDIAVIAMKIDDPDVRGVVTPLTLATNPVVSGDAVSAYGYPMGQPKLKYTEGTFSGFSNGLLQHSSAISPGNSGGPLICNGEVVGINSSTVVGGGATSVHFAVPIDLYRRLSKTLLAGEVKVIHPPKLGFCYHEVTESMIQYQLRKIKGGGESIRSGIHVHHLFDTSPLKHAGMKEGAIINRVAWETEPGRWSRDHALDRYGEVLVEWNGNERVPVEHALARVPLGSRIRVMFIQDNEIKKIVTKPVDIRTGSLRIMTSPFETMPEYVIFAGICVMPLYSNHAEHLPQLFLQLTPKDREKDFLVVTSILPGYESVPLRTGSIIRSVNRVQPIRTIAEYRKAMQNPLDGYISITDTNLHTYILDVDTILAQETTYRDRGLYIPDKLILSQLTGT